MTGNLRLSFRHLVIMHVWQCRNARGKKLIPHARLLSTLLENCGATGEAEFPLKKPHTVFSFKELKNEKWSYVKTKKWHKLKMGPGEQVKVLQWGKEAPKDGEMDDLDSSDEELMRRKRAAGLIAGEGSSSQQPRAGQPGYSWGVFDDETQARVVSSRPSEYATWEPFERALYDQSSRHEATRMRDHQAQLEHAERLARMQHMQDQMELNMRAYDENQLRRHMDYYAGVPYVENPPYVDYQTEPPYEPGMPRHPTPQVHGSMWIPSEYTAPHYQSSYPYQPPPYEYPQQQQQQQAGEPSDDSGGIFYMSSFYEHFGQYYNGPPGPSYH